MAKLTYKQRQKLPSSAFVFPEEEAYPIHDEAHARNALARAAQNETGARLAKIVRAVQRRYPNIEISGDLLRKARRG
jgi:hypothetical protein